MTMGFFNWLWLFPRPLALLVTVISLTGCASYGVVQNQPASTVSSPKSYSLATFAKREHSDETLLILAFSGGGTRAAALAYGVLQELRDTPIKLSGRNVRMLDEVDTISSVSGGSFTAAYFGLHGDRIFDDFEAKFLRRNVQRSLINGLLSPLLWFSSTGRTELAVQFYEDTVFKGATFGDMLARSGPMIMINASDLGYGARFTFIQEYFDLLCSDLLSFPVARAVTASSAVPLLFNPVVVQNYPDCKDDLPDLLSILRERAKDDEEMQLAVHGLESYLNKDQRKYAHFVDGGITDNLGLRAIYELITLSGGPNEMLNRLGTKIPRRLVLISVNAATSPEPAMDQSNRQPSLEESASAMSDIQIHRYNAATIKLIRGSMREWAGELSTAEQPVGSYFVDLNFRSVTEKRKNVLLNLTPTSFSLTGEQVDLAIETGRDLLRSNTEFRRLVRDMAN